MTELKHNYTNNNNNNNGEEASFIPDEDPVEQRGPID
jgi:hypothetical protein